jgi:peptidoglycan/LPS O-acetylase OafA/YrhL
VLLAGQPSDDFLRFVVRHTFPGRILEFLIGAWAALLLTRGRVRARSGWWTYGGFAAFACGLLVMILRQQPGVPAHRADGFAFNVLFSLAVLPWSTALLILGLSLEVTWISRFLAHPVMVLCGRASYVFYLIHMGFVAGILAKYLHLHHAFHFVVMNLISIAAFLLYEEPMRNFITTHARNRRARLARA